MSMNISPVAMTLPISGPAISRDTATPTASGAQETMPVQALPHEAVPSPPLSNESIKQIARQIDEFLKTSSANLEVSVDSESDEVIVRVVDAETQELIRQIPSKEMLAISRAIDHMKGLLLQQTA